MGIGGVRARSLTCSRWKHTSLFAVELYARECKYICNMVSSFECCTRVITTSIALLSKQDAAAAVFLIILARAALLHTWGVIKVQ
jgi:hypothetical protein